MTDTLQTPPPFPTEARPPAPRPDTTLRNALLAVGSVAIVGVLVLGVVQFAQAGTGDDQSGSYEVTDGFESVVIDTSAADVTVRYDDSIDTARIDFDSGDAPLRFEQQVRGDRLAISVRARGWWPFGGLFGLSGLGDATLDVTLPADLAPVGLDIDTSAGDVVAEGEFTDLSLDSSAGNIELAGSADSLTLSSSAGNVSGTDLDVTGAVSGDSSAGNTTLRFITLPSSILLDSSAGNVRVALPDGDYEIRTDTSAGNVELGVVNTPGADRVYSFDTSAGNVVLERAAR